MRRVVKRDSRLLENSTPVAVDPDKLYRFAVRAGAEAGRLYSSYFVYIALDQHGREIRRRIRWLDRFDGSQTDYTIQARPHFGATHVIIGYRINGELPPQIAAPADVIANLPPIESLVLDVCEDQEAAEEYSLDWFDYEREWRIVDLDADEYHIVGPQSKDEYQSAGRHHFALLLDAGVKPSSSILDVGCGTGSLVPSAAAFLDDDGLYWGTDIAEEAIQYCRQKHPTRFRFTKNASASIPIEGVAFDFVSFFSVFTHTFPEETLGLLRDARRLLKGSGTLIADIYVCPTAREYTGTRDRIEMNEAYFRGLAREAGFTRFRRFSGGAGLQSAYFLQP